MLCKIIKRENYIGNSSRSLCFLYWACYADQADFRAGVADELS